MVLSALDGEAAGLLVGSGARNPSREVLGEFELLNRFLSLPSRLERLEVLPAGEGERWIIGAIFVPAKVKIQEKARSGAPARLLDIYRHVHAHVV